MGRVPVKRAVRARLGVLTGGCLVSAGAWTGLGVAVGLVVAGVLLIAYFLLLTDVDEPATEPKAGGDGP